MDGLQLAHGLGGQIGEQPLADKASGPRRAARMTVTALIVAAGKGERLGGGMPKQYRMLGGKPVLRWAVEALVAHPAVNALRVVIGKGQQELAAAALDGLDVGPFIEGGDGARRFRSCRPGTRLPAMRCWSTMRRGPFARPRLSTGCSLPWNFSKARRRCCRSATRSRGRTRSARRAGRSDRARPRADTPGVPPRCASASL